MAGGKGTRLGSMTKDIPKPMISIENKPILEYQIESLRKSNITDIILVIGYLGDVIKEYFGDGHPWGVKIEYIVEEDFLGTAGALYYIKNVIRESFILIFGDLVLDIDWIRFMNFHNRSNADITLFVHPNSHPYDSDVIVTDKQNRVTDILYKNKKRNLYYHNLVNAGIYGINPCVLDDIILPEKMDLDRDIIVKWLPRQKVFAYSSSEYVKDMGTLDRFYSVSEDIRKGIVESRSFRNAQKAIFLDRDGTINKSCGFLKSAEQFELLLQVAEAVKRINTSEYLVIVVTNQPVVARGECSLVELDQIHMKLEMELAKEGAYVDALYFCPHHPDKGYLGEIPELKIECNCRKPKIGMITEAAERFHIDIANSWYIGDTTTDIQTGINAGLKTVLVLTGEAGKDGKYQVQADITAENLLMAVNKILGD